VTRDAGERRDRRPRAVLRATGVLAVVALSAALVAAWRRLVLHRDRVKQLDAASRQEDRI